jgi:hypothetical protein
MADYEQGAWTFQTNGQISGPKATRLAAYLDSLADPSNWHDRVLTFLFQQGAYGATNDECEVALGCQFTTAGAVIIRLREEGWVIDSGRTRLTRRGHQAVVWIALEEQQADPVVAYRGKGKHKRAVEEAYALMQCGGWEEAMSVLAAALGKN